MPMEKEERLLCLILVVRSAMFGVAVMLLDLWVYSMMCSACSVVSARSRGMYRQCLGRRV